MDIKETEAAVEAILFASGEPVPVEKIAAVLGTGEDEIYSAAERLADEYSVNRRGIRLLRLENRLQMTSSPEFAGEVVRALEQRRPPRLSPAALETLAIVAYYQPVTRAYIEQVRGVDSSYTVGVLADKGLIEPCGKLEVPGRPTLFKTGDGFLRTMGISSLDELPPLPDLTSDEGIIALQNTIDAMKNAENGEDAQMKIEES
ncbi:MAG: SMC-Scp complex subunit ScpB [Oscillospiraceae bacterium]|nr:SMC-Scp complex subunit ScpB [Oscillospiraceae bacterium]MCD8066710.1 SMC-Scp complex subunit ScpB [Oscillospiraceae bacterium]MCD8099709.1 SMC-Scp complex subunit ScpB [Oscillospiraceae bacterium]MCD8192261.1 SMC-Scp complex subunit ScpB [Oscillospiraceae bacterium]